MLKTAEKLRKLGVDVDTSTDLNPQLENYDLIHLMNITRVKFTYLQLMNARKYRKKIVLSPIYWNTRNAFSSYLTGPLRSLDLPNLMKDLGRSYVSSILRRQKIYFNEFSEWMTNKKLASIVLREAEFLLPNSPTELNVLKNDFAEVFRRGEKKVEIVPNGVDTNIFLEPSPKDFVDKYGVTDFVLCVGRFGFRKNQISLIRALKGCGIKTIFIGGPPDNSNFYWLKDAVDRSYYQKCKSEADSSFIFVPTMPHSALASAYAACKVLAVPSFYETPGLVALEAALAEANICITSGGSTRDYFSDYAWYVDPYSLASIRHAVLSAYRSSKNSRLKQHVLDHFTWDHAARITLKAYEKVVEK